LVDKKKTRERNRRKNGKNEKKNRLNSYDENQRFTIPSESEIMEGNKLTTLRDPKEIAEFFNGSPVRVG